MKVSIITATYNSEKNIRDTIESCLQQTYKDIEYLIIDGASTDHTVEIAKEYGGKISKLISEPDTGIYNALNKGINAATGDIIGFLHSDDIFFSNDTVSHVVEHFLKYQVDSIYGNGIYTSANNKNKVIRNWISGEFNPKKLSLGWMPLHPTFFVKRNIYMQYGLFEESFRIAADYDLVLTFLKDAEISTFYINEYLIRMKMGGASTSASNFAKKWKEDVRVMRRHGINPCIGLPYKNLSKIKQLVSK